MKLRFLIKKGNDYYCGCCRRTWEDTEDFDSMEEAVEELVKQRVGLFGDLSVLEVIEIPDEPEDLSSQFDELFQPAFQEAWDKKQEKNKKEKEEEREASERRKLKQLKEKYEN